MTTWYINSNTCSAWTASTAYALGARTVVDRGAGNSRKGYVHECTTAGTSGASRPNWGFGAVGSTVTDNTVVWTVRQATTWANASCFFDYTMEYNVGPVVTGDTVYVKNTHDSLEPGSTRIPNGAGTFALPVRVISVSDSAEPPVTYAPGAKLRLQGYNTFYSTSYEFDGIEFQAGVGSSSANMDFSWAGSGDTYYMRFKDCTFKLMSTHATNRYNLGNSNAITSVVFDNCTFSFSNTSQFIYFPYFAKVEFVDCSIDPATPSVPNTLFGFLPTGLSIMNDILIRDCDFSVMTGGTVVDGANFNGGSFIMRNCKIAPGALLVNSAITHTPGCVMIFDNVDTGDTNYKMVRCQLMGDITVDTTYVRSGGASDGATTISWKMTADGDTSFLWPLRSPAIVTWNDIVGTSKSVTVEFLCDTATSLTNLDIWLEVEYLGNNGSTLGTFTGRPEPLATSTTHTSSAESWVTTSMTAPKKQKMSVTFTPEEKGPIMVVVCVAKKSTTIYVDPKLALA